MRGLEKSQCLDNQDVMFGNCFLGVLVLFQLFDYHIEMATSRFAANPHGRDFGLVRRIMHVALWNGGPIGWGALRLSSFRP
jgi:hypothetical protein